MYFRRQRVVERSFVSITAWQTFDWTASAGVGWATVLSHLHGAVDGGFVFRRRDFLGTRQAQESCGSANNQAPHPEQDRDPGGGRGCEDATLMPGIKHR